MDKENINTDNYKELKNCIENLINFLEENGWELDNNGDIIEKKSKRLVWDILNEK